MTLTATGQPTLMERLTDYYKDHPGMHRCMDISPYVEIPTHRVAVLSRRLYDRNVIDRRLVRVPGRKTPVTLYGLPKR